MVIVALARGPIRAKSANGNVPQDSVCTVQKDEIEVYVGLLKLNALPQGPLVLVTTTEATDARIDHTADMLHAAKTYTIPSELREDFKARNASSCTIGTFTGIKNLSFIFDAELAGQRDIQKRYGKNAVLIRFSRVGFNSDKSLASLNVSFGVDHIAGSGTLYLLKKEGDAWTIGFTVNTKLYPGPARP
jgi:hypothetical protein